MYEYEDKLNKLKKDLFNSKMNIMAINRNIKKIDIYINKLTLKQSGSKNLRFSENKKQIKKAPIINYKKQTDKIKRMMKNQKTRL
jgi:t-SNARE complex subunit (syntaxin)